MSFDSNAVSALSVGLRMFRWGKTFPLLKKKKKKEKKKWYIGYKTRPHLIVRFQFWRSGKFEVHLHCYYSWVYTDPE